MLNVTVCGYDSNHRKPCNLVRHLPENEYLILLVKKEAWFYVNNEKITTPANMLILFNSSSQIHYGCDTPGYNDDWIHFTIDKEDLIFFRELSIPFDKPLYPHDFHGLCEIVAMMTKAKHKNSAHSKDIVNHYMKLFLLSLSDQISESSTTPLPKYYPEIARIRTEIYNSPTKNWVVPELANSLYLSVSYFQHLYKNFMGTSCQKDITTARMNLAKFYLASSNMSVKEISDFSGYDNELHFMRQFKKSIGMTPTEYRKNQESV